MLVRSASLAEESETSDYQRSTPSPSDDGSHANADDGPPALVREHDPGLGDEIKVEDPALADDEHRQHLSLSPETFYKKAKKRSSSSSPQKSSSSAKRSRRRLEDITRAILQRARADVAQASDLAAVDATCRRFVQSAVACPGTSLADRLILLRDPKIMRSTTRVRLERLGSADDLRSAPGLVVSASEDAFARINVSPSKRRKSDSSFTPATHDNLSSWFAKRTPLKIEISDDPMASPQGPSWSLGGGLIRAANVGLIRPAVLNLDMAAASTSSFASTSKFSSFPSSSSASASSVNPFAPSLKASSYLFGGSADDDFERVPDDDLIIVSDEEEEEEEEEEEDEEEEEEKKEALPLVPIKAKIDVEEVIEEEEVKPEEVVDEKSIVNLSSPVKKKKCDEEPHCQNEATTSTATIATTIATSSTAAESEIAEKAKSDEKASSSSVNLRFPSLAPARNLIECRWQGCQMMFKTYGRLSDHIKVSFFVFLP